MGDKTNAIPTPAQPQQQSQRSINEAADYGGRHHPHVTPAFPSATPRRNNSRHTPGS